MIKCVLNIMLLINLKGLKKCLQNIEMVDKKLQKIGISKEYHNRFVAEMGSISAMLFILVAVITLHAFNMSIKGTPLHIRTIFVIASHFPITLYFNVDMMFLAIIR